LRVASDTHFDEIWCQSQQAWLNRPSPWQNALGYLNVVIAEMDNGQGKSKVLNQWSPPIRTLLESGANPFAMCSRSTRYVNKKYKRMASDQQWSVFEVIGRAYDSEPQTFLEQHCEQLKSSKKKARLRISQIQATDYRKSCRPQ
jgi:hypothetical protein